MKNLSLSLNSATAASVNGIPRNSPTRSSIKFVPPLVVPQASSSVTTSEAAPTATTTGNGNLNYGRQSNPSLNTTHRSTVGAVCESLPPPMQLIPEQSAISMFKPALDDNVGGVMGATINSNSHHQQTNPSCDQFERVSPPSTLLEQLKFNRYSNSSLDSGQGSDSIKLHSQNNRVSVHSCESLGSTTESTSQQSSLSSSSSTSSSFCSSSSSTSSSGVGGLQNHHQHHNPHVSLHGTASTISTPPETVAMSNSSNVFGGQKTSFVGAVPNGILKNASTKEISGKLASAGPPTIAEMLLHGVSDTEIIHNWLLKIGMSKYEHQFSDAAYDMASIAKMTPQDLSSIGITDPKVRSFLTSEIQKLNIPESLPDYIPCSLEEWLKLLNLHCYYQSLVQENISTIEKVAELTWEDLEDVGIGKLGHQKKILLAIKKIRALRAKAAKEARSPMSDGGSDIYGTIQQQQYKPTIMGGVGGGGGAQNNTTPQRQFVVPNLLPNQHTAFVSVHHNPLPPAAHFQEMPIKINANHQLNSPTTPTPSNFSGVGGGGVGGENSNNYSVIHPVRQVPNCYPNAAVKQAAVMSSMNSPQQQMSTFQQLTDMERMNLNPNFVPGTLNNTGIYGQIGYDSGLSNLATFGRGKSLESLDNIDPKFYPYYSNQRFQNISQHQQQQQQQHQAFLHQQVPPQNLVYPTIQQQHHHQPPYQFAQRQGSVNDIYSLNNRHQNSLYDCGGPPPPPPHLASIQPLPSLQSFNFLQSGPGLGDPNSTLCRPKSFLQKPKPIAMIPARPSSTQPDLYMDCNFDTMSVKSSGEMSVASDSTLSCKSDLGMYGTLKKKPPPPPPPKRTNSVRTINSLPTTPVHKKPTLFDDEQIYSNLAGLVQQQQQHHLPPPPPQAMPQSPKEVLSFSEDVFASCVKSLRNQFNEIHSFRDEDFQQTSQSLTMNALNVGQQQQQQQQQQQLQQQQQQRQMASMANGQPQTTPATPVSHENNISNSSSTESMPFANDNIGTIRQKQSSFLQNALRMAHESNKSHSSSSSSSPSVSSPMFANSFPNPPQNLTSSVDSSKQVADSLDDIEKMLANLKTQLDQIE